MRYFVFISLLSIRMVFAQAPNSFTDFAFRDLNQEVVESDEIRKGKVLLFKIGQLSCPVCTLVLEQLGKLDQEYAARGVVFLDISLDDDVEALRAHAKAHDVDFSTLMDERGDLASWFGVSTIPVTVVVDRKGVITDYVVGDLSEVQIRKMLDTALAMP